MNEHQSLRAIRRSGRVQCVQRQPISRRGRVKSASRIINNSSAMYRTVKCVVNRFSQNLLIYWLCESLKRSLVYAISVCERNTRRSYQDMSRMTEIAWKWRSIKDRELRNEDIEFPQTKSFPAHRLARFVPSWLKKIPPGWRLRSCRERAYS